jgi:phospholipid-transporting ATPase
VLNGKGLLLRGAFLRNTEWIIGVVTYTGEDTKIMRNAEPARIK